MPRGRGVGVATSPAADRVYVGSNPTPSSKDCALYALALLEELLSRCGVLQGLQKSRPLEFDPSGCALLDVELFAVIGLLRELLEMAELGRCEGAIEAARDAVRRLSGRRDLPEAAWGRLLGAGSGAAREV